MISLLELKSLATTRSLARGEAYFKDGRVHGLTAHEGTCTATVRGQDDYFVTLRSTEHEIDYSCDCPIGLEGEFCKHLVAVGLAALNLSPGSKGRPSNRKQTAGKYDLFAYLERQDKDTLVDILAREATENRNLYDRLLLEAVQSNPAGFDITAFSSINRARDADRRIYRLSFRVRLYPAHPSSDRVDGSAT